MVSSFVGSGCSVGSRPVYTRRPGRLHPDPSTPRIMAETPRKANPFPAARARILHNPPPRRPPPFSQRLEESWFLGGFTWIATSVAVFRAWGARKHSPPSERGVPPGGRIGNGIVPPQQMERAAGGVLREAVDACVHLAHPQNSRFVRCRCGVALAATAKRSTPPVAAPAAFLLPCMDIPFMAAPPPSRRGAEPGTLLDPCIRGIRAAGQLKSKMNQAFGLSCVTSAEGKTPMAGGTMDGGGGGGGEGRVAGGNQGAGAGGAGKSSGPQEKAQRSSSGPR